MAGTLLRSLFLAAAFTTWSSAADPGYWLDKETGLLWTSTDNGSGISRVQAGRYCQELSLGGFRDWRLPSINELQRLFGGPADGGGHHVRGPLQLSGWQWSATEGERPGESWSLDFGDGGRASVASGDSGLNRASCVRSSK